MIKSIYVVFDTAAAVGERPFVARTDGEVLRAFSDMAIRDGHDIAAHPEHYSLFKIGEYDDVKMRIKELAPECLATGVEMVAQAQKIVPGSLKENGVDDAQVSDGALVQPGSKGEHTAQ